MQSKGLTTSVLSEPIVEVAGMQKRGLSLNISRMISNPYVRCRTEITRRSRYLLTVATKHKEHST